VKCFNLNLQTQAVLGTLCLIWEAEQLQAKINILNNEENKKKVKIIIFG
jgi:hypothetical protein